MTMRGIRANPKHTKTIIDMSGPKNKKEIQRLIGRMAALGHSYQGTQISTIQSFILLRNQKLGC